MKVQGLSPLLVVFCFVGCRAPSPRTHDMVVSAAISLKEPMESLATIYRERYRDIQIRLNFGSSGLLCSQIEQGAPVDVYASASVTFLDELEQKGLLIPGTRRDLAGNRLVLIVPINSSWSLSEWDKLVSIDNLALGNPKTVPAGAYAKQCLESLGLWDELEPRLVFAEHVRQVLDYVGQAEVEAGLVYATDAQILRESVRVIAEAPKESHAPIRYGIAAVGSSRMADAAREFIDLATSSTGVEVHTNYGFSPPES